MSETTGRNVPDPLRVPNDEHVPWLLRKVWDRVNQRNMHFMGCIVGEEGSGKSYTAVKICKAVDPTFNADRIFFDVGELLRMLKNGEHEPGNFYVLDEAGVQFGRRTWQDRAQVLANQALQLVRDHNLGLVFTLPRLGELDSQAQGRLQAFIELIEKNEHEDPPHVTGKWKWMDPDRTDEHGNILKPYPRRREGGVVKKIRRVRFTPPDQDIIDDYEKRKDKFQEEFYEEVIEELDDEFDDEEESEEESEKEIATRIAKEGLGDYVSIHGNTGDPYINHDLIKAVEEISNAKARAVRALLEKQFAEEDLREYV